MSRRASTSSAIVCLLLLLEGGTRGVAVASDQRGGSGIAVLGALIRTFEVRAGADVEGLIRVKNSSTEPQVVRAYHADYAPPGGTINGFVPPGTLPRSNAKWIQLIPEQQLVPAGATAGITVRINAPADVQESGTFWSVVMVEEVPSSTLEPSVSSESRVAIREVFRTAVRIVTEVESAHLPAAPSLRFVGRSIRTGDAGAELHLSLQNDGPSQLRLELWVELFDERGTSIGRRTAQELSLLPGQVGARHIALTGIPPGTYEALVVADNRALAVFGARYRLDLREPASLTMRRRLP